MTDESAHRNETPVSHFISAPDGLRLHVAEYGARLSDLVPVVCLAGLTRNSRDFDTLARRLAAGGRRVLAPDYRGRGLSARDRKWQNYNLEVEGKDIQAVLTALGIRQAIFVGTSRGGLHIMALAARQPTLIAAAVLNDVGPIVEPQGLIRIKTHTGALPPPTNWAEAADMLRRTYGQQFPALDGPDWAILARATVRESNERLAWDYDPALAKTLATISPDTPPVDLWPQFRALARVPVLAIRGANSDILSEATFKAMQDLPNCRGYLIEGQGHAPLLADAASVAAIEQFVERL
jgi:pimeloyl-ACP methyl ester carboxylesterase